MAEPLIEYRVCWSASGNITFRGEGQWWPAEPGETAEGVEEALARGSRISDGLAYALNESGFEWWIETREKSHTKEAASAAPEKEQTQ